jgi:hypothetical protein
LYFVILISLRQKIALTLHSRTTNLSNSGVMFATR